LARASADFISWKREPSRARHTCRLSRFRPTKIVEAEDALTIVSTNKMEMTMRKTILTLLFIPLIAAVTVQATAASERHDTRAKDRAVASEQLRNSNAYAAPDDIAVQSNRSDYDEGAMTSGIAGH
jgi:hypothetical protein